MSQLSTCPSSRLTPSASKTAEMSTKGKESVAQLQEQAPQAPQQRVTRQVSFAATSQGETLASSAASTASPSNRTAMTWLASYATRPKPEAPERFPYDFKNILSFPARVFRPPQCQECYAVEAEVGAEEEEMAPDSAIRPVDTKVKGGKPRTLKKTPLNHVKLREVLENRYQPPLTRKEFANYLNWEERSSENHFFYSWLEGYTTQYEEWIAEQRSALQASTVLQAEQPVTADNYAAYVASNLARRGEGVAAIAPTPRMEAPLRPEDLPQHLRQTLALALDAFFTPTSHLQLNLDEAVVNRIRTDAAHSPDPGVFKPARDAVQLMLEDSLNRYLREVSGNAGRYRSAFAVILGAVVVLAAFVPFAFALAHHWPRALRLVCLPLLFAGTLTAVGGLRRTCLVIFLFGTARQLRMFELEMPTAAQKPRVRRPSLWSGRSNSTSGRKDSDADTAYDSPIAEKNARKKDSMATIAVASRQASTEKTVAVAVGGNDGEKVILPTLMSQDQPSPQARLSLSDPAALANVVNILSLTPSQTSSEREREDGITSAETRIKMDGGIAESPVTAASPNATFTNPWDNMSVADSSSLDASRTARSAPVFAGLTKVLAPEVIRAQRDAIVTGAQYGLAVTLVLGGIMMGVPNA